ncbi:hypothetical protein Ddye_008934 [Dipteronia dyeriana]|uniref:cytokinin riboside 5'-monophosphate phosphoribohydrolase n=1 Tax=Dipteronia dyeriana TaxID=168575 RepID=A0AAD9XAT2_9ROSI|nr:hypothetical protein Ddye_008934 [Dipteronia dyeriana]
MASPSTKRFSNIYVFGGTNYRKYREFVEAATHLAAADIIGKKNGEELVVSGMPERLTAMLHHGDEFIALPGGFRTLEEIFTIASLAQLHIHEKPIGLLNVNKFYDGFLSFLDHAQKNYYIPPSIQKIFISVSSPHELIDQLQAFNYESDPSTSKIDWSIDKKNKKCRIDLNLNL